MANLNALLSQIDSGSVLLPEFQRGYVWNRDQVRGLFRSLYLGYPIGSLLVWETEVSETGIRNDSTRANATRTLLLDGQQRITSLYGVVRGAPPKFFEGDEKAFKDLFFSVEDETFEFYAPVKMKGNPLWIDVTKLFKTGIQPYLEIFSEPQYQQHFSLYLMRLNRVNEIMNREFHLEKIVGENKTIDVVVDIFNKVNSGGTQLSKGDLALARLAAEDPSIRQKMREELANWNKAGFKFELDWLLRNVTAVATGRAKFASLENVSASDFAAALPKTVKYVNHVLNQLGGRLGLDHGRVLINRYAIPVLVRYLHTSGGTFKDSKERDKALYWFVHAGMWGRFSGSTESMLDQDYEALAREGLDGIIENLKRTRGGELKVTPGDFSGFGLGSRFYPILYMLTRTHGARDFGWDLELKESMLGKMSSLQVHHTFPKKVLYEKHHSKSEVNDVANFVFLTAETNLKIGATAPEEYFPDVANISPGALESQWIPMDRELWKTENYLDFLKARRLMLAEATNRFLSGLLTGETESIPELEKISVPESLGEFDGDDLVDVLMNQLEEFSIADPERNVEVVDPDSGQVLCIAEALWPDGLQPGRGAAVILELNEVPLAVSRLQALGYLVFTDTDSLLDFVKRQAAIDSDGSAD